MIHSINSYQIQYLCLLLLKIIANIIENSNYNAFISFREFVPFLNNFYFSKLHIFLTHITSNLVIFYSQNSLHHVNKNYNMIMKRALIYITCISTYTISIIPVILQLVGIVDIDASIHQQHQDPLNSSNIFHIFHHLHVR